MINKNFIDTIIDLKKIKAKTSGKKIGFKRMLQLGLGGTVGGPIFVILGISLGVAKAGLLISLAINGLLMISFVANFSELALSLSITGEGYRVLKDSLGPSYEFLFAWFIWIGNMIFAGLSARSFAYSIKIFFPPLQLTDRNIDIIAAVILFVFYIMNLKFNKKHSVIMKYLTILLVGGFVFYIVVGLIGGPLVNDEFSGKMFHQSIEFLPVLSQTAYTFIIFCIYEWLSSFTLMMAKFEKIQRPKENIPRTYLIAIFIGVILYLGVALTTILNVGSTNSSLWDNVISSDLPLATTFEEVFGIWGAIVIGITGMIATLTSINAGMQMSSHILFSMGRDEFMPKTFTKSKGNVKNMALHGSFIISLLFTVFWDVNLMTNVTGFIFLASVGFLCIAVVLMRKSRPNLERPWKVPGYPYTPIISGVACFVLMLTIDFWSIIWSVVLFFTGLIYFLIWVYVFNHSAVLEREDIIERREESLKQRELDILLMKSKMARKTADKLTSSESIDLDKYSEEKINFIQRLKNFEAIENRSFENVEEIREATENIDRKLEKLKLILRLEELERLEQKGRENLESLDSFEKKEFEREEEKKEFEREEEKKEFEREDENKELKGEKGKKGNHRVKKSKEKMKKRKRKKKKFIKKRKKSKNKSKSKEMTEEKAQQNGQEILERHEKESQMFETPIFLKEKEPSVQKLAMYDLIRNILHKEQDKISELKDLEYGEEELISAKSEELIGKLEKIEEKEMELVEKIRSLYENEIDEEQKKKGDWKSIFNFLKIFQNKENLDLKQYRDSLGETDVSVDMDVVQGKGSRISRKKKKQGKRPKRKKRGEKTKKGEKKHIKKKPPAKKLEKKKTQSSPRKPPRKEKKQNVNRSKMEEETPKEKEALGETKNVELDLKELKNRERKELINELKNIEEKEKKIKEELKEIHEKEEDEKEENES